MEFSVGDTVRHQTYGEGEVTHVFGTDLKKTIAVKFEATGPKIFDPRLGSLQQVRKAYPVEDLDPEMPVRIPVGARSKWRWKGAEFATREEMLLGKALLNQGAMVAPSAHLILRESSKLHRKPDLLVFLPHEDRLLTGIAEVDGSAHDGRWVEDQTRSHELQRNGFMAVRHYTAEQVFEDPTKTATDFLAFLRQFHPFGQRDILPTIERPARR